MQMMRPPLALLLLLGDIGVLRDAVLVTDPLPLTEYYSRTLKNYSRLRWDEIGPHNAAPMLRVRNLQDADFQELVRRAYPFIVDDCVPEGGLRDMPCSEYGRRWPREHMRAEYTPGQHHIFLEDPTWYSEQKPTATVPKHLSLGKPLSGPYIWHVKDETDLPETKPTIAAMFPVPYFLNSSALNANEARDSFEFWFVLENGGSQAHADAYCETTISMQLRGRKKWRLGAFPNITNAFQPYMFHDGEIYDYDQFWQPEHEEVVEPGQCMVFPMGYIHETYVGDGDAGEDGCSVASTFQFQEPQPIFQWRNFLARWGLSHYSRDEPCLHRMAPYFNLDFGSKWAGTDEREVLEASAKVFASIDADGDGKLTLHELMPRFRRQPFQPPWTLSIPPHVIKEVMGEKVAWVAEDALLLHDLDGDGSVSLAEYQEGVLKFAAVKARVKHLPRRKPKDPKRLFKRERQWLRQHMCQSDQCDVLEQLARDAGERSEL